MMSIVVAYYVPVLILAARDPLVRGIVFDAGIAVSACASRAIINAVCHAAAFTLKSVRTMRHSEEWIIVGAE